MEPIVLIMAAIGGATALGLGAVAAAQRLEPERSRAQLRTRRKRFHRRRARSPVSSPIAGRMSAWTNTESKSRGTI
jgi:hypothetical protein